MKKLLIILILLLLSNYAYARDLEIDYPQIGETAIETTETSIPAYVEYIYSFVVYSVGFIALLSILVAGITYLASSGDPQKRTLANKRIINTFLGLLIIFSSLLLLETISPSFLEIKVEDLTPIEGELLPPLPPTDYGNFKYAPETVDLLERIDSLMTEIKKEVPMAEHLAHELRDAVNYCNCNVGESICGIE